MKKFLSFLFVLMLALCLVACGGSNEPKPDPDPTPGPGPSGDPSDDPTGGDVSDVKRDVPVSESGLTNMLGTGKLYVTTFGQADKAYLKEIVDEATEDGTKVEYTYDDQLKASDVEDGSLVIAVVGYTKKGISADITQTGEVSRAQAFAQKAGINLVVVQLSGSARRGESSDPIISAAVAGAKLVMIYDGGNTSGANYDGAYTEWCKDTQLFQFSDEWDINEYVKVIVGA